MAWLTERELNGVGFKSLGVNVKISDRAIIYKPECISLGNNVQIDDFCVISNNITINNNVHIALYSCLISSNDSHIEMEDFSVLAYRCQVLASSDDYSGCSMTNSTIPMEFKKNIQKPVKICKHSIVGAGSTIMPGVILNEGTAIGAMSLVLKSTEAWSVMVGIPARKIKDRQKDLLELEKKYLEAVK